MGTAGLFPPGVKLPGREAEVKEMWIYTSTPLYAFMHRDNFTSLIMIFLTY
jgi:hypothetical protein